VFAIDPKNESLRFFYRPNTE